jgi:hypothetical protein
MPLYLNAPVLIRANLEQLAHGRKVRPQPVGTLTARQLGSINLARQARFHPLPVVIAEVLFIGQHIYNSRLVRDGYTIEDVFDQIASAMAIGSIFVPTSKMAAIQNHERRLNRYGCYVQDMAIFECTARHPRPELFSVIPKGDKPPKN